MKKAILCIIREQHAPKYLIFINSRTSLIRHHEYLLRFDGEGHYEFRE